MHESSDELPERDLVFVMMGGGELRDCPGK